MKSEDRINPDDLTDRTEEMLELVQKISLFMHELKPTQEAGLGSLILYYCIQMNMRGLKKETALLALVKSWEIAEKY